MSGLSVTLPFSVSAIPVGSRVTCSPAPTDTDRDWLALIPKGESEEFTISMMAIGWDLGGSRIPVNRLINEQDDRFLSFTHEIDGVIENVIATESEVFYRRFLVATLLATRFNLMIKDDRVALFQGVLYGNDVTTLDDDAAIAKAEGGAA